MAAALRNTPVQILKRAWERIAPLQLADRSWDNVGIIIESPIPNLRHRHVLLTIDLTSKVCQEALAIPTCSLIVSYHPPIFRALKSITMSDPLQSSLLQLAARGISVFSPHTSLDAIPDGINTWLLQAFTSDTSSSRPIIPSEPIVGFEGAGVGRTLKLSEGLDIKDAVAKVKKHLNLSHVQVAQPVSPASIGSVAVCAGSGGSVLRDAQGDLLVTGEISHHEILAAIAKGQYVILCNHSNTERPYLSQTLRPWLEKELNIESGEGKWTVVVSQADKDPLETV